MKKIVKDVCGALIEKDGRVLIAQRNKNDTFGLKWEFPGGAVEKGESKEQCLARELEEELGIEVEVGEPIGIFEDEIPVLKIIIFLYRCTITKGTPRALECKDFAWMKFDALETMDLAPADRKIYTFLKKNYGKSNDN